MKQQTREPDAPAARCAPPGPLSGGAGGAHRRGERDYLLPEGALEARAGAFLVPEVAPEVAPHGVLHALLVALLVHLSAHAVPAARAEHGAAPEVTAHHRRAEQPAAAAVVVAAAAQHAHQAGPRDAAEYPLGQRAAQHAPHAAAAPRGSAPGSA